MKKWFWVFGGGGNKGGYQEGVIRAAVELNHQPDAVAGTSVGALNGSFVAMRLYHVLAYFWDLVEVHGYPEIWDSWLVKEVAGSLTAKFGGIAGLLLQGQLNKIEGLGTLRPLREKLSDYVKLADFRIPFLCGITSLTDGQYHSINIQDCLTDADAVDAIVASATMPIIWDPVPAVRTTKGTFFQCTDGGVQSITPIKEAIDFINRQPDAKDWGMVIVPCGTDQMEPHPEPYSLMGVVGRVMDMMLNQIFMTDISRFKLINEFVAASVQPTLDGYRHIPSIIIQPSANLGSTLDSRAEAIRFRRSLGYQDAKQQLTSFS
ncbi:MULTISPECIES: patatin-like phospholipase family protein [unclassified Spirosoma]|uniref:patatin-like phospholipase family protein n=1 Tax=unclassified Spirosoma TaxID=2621999 RepID=UPI000962F1C2|nr:MULTISPECIES: patatin-like phospholipase family protein [unclassified Spirosoma]MBN8820760.1 patatin-like phospholipase family protein [Spirosoma sp.]OJW78058.1 MAG: hypothetical protein BGO59_29000 [Spirosoma sp. 48-14]